MNEEEKIAIEYLKTRLYGNKSCKYIDIAQEDLRIFIKLINRLQKENKELKKFHIQDNKHLDFIMQHSIPVQKVKDKIKELEEEGYWLFTTDRDSDKCVEVLQQLLEKEQ